MSISRHTNMYVHTLMQQLSILPANPSNKIHTHIHILIACLILNALITALYPMLYIHVESCFPVSTCSEIVEVDGEVCAPDVITSYKYDDTCGECQLFTLSCIFCGTRYIHVLGCQELTISGI